ncbi:growth-regulating factor 1-like isoform X2 [Phalaenopsis equestris]|nr:growth-regulating factor 1-like isoform X2 [Phalaenopsis equestris]
MMMGGRSSSRYPFTASQWQELEHQALIFKYMASGIPIPSDLILPIRRSFLLDSTTTSPSLVFPPQTQLGWSCFQMGFGKKAEDLEPGRCRRTDGKKWRCSKEAYPDSKYCERHMHRGKNRSRKPVEISLAAKTNHSSSSSSSSSSAQSPYLANLSISTPETNYHLSCPFSNSSRPPWAHLSSDSGASHLQYGEDGMKDLEGCSFFSGMTGTERESSSQLEAMGMSSIGQAKQSSYSLSKEEEEERQKTLRHFFDEWPQRNKDPWMDIEEENSSYTKTQLSISFPK